MRTCPLCSNISPRYPQLLSSTDPPLHWHAATGRALVSPPTRRRCATRSRRAQTWRTPTGPGSPCRSWGTSSTRGTSSRPKSSCCRRSWRTTKGAQRSEYEVVAKRGLIFDWPAEFFTLASDETEDETVTPSTSPSPEPRSRSRSSTQPESGIKRLYVKILLPPCVKLTSTPFKLQCYYLWIRPYTPGLDLSPNCPLVAPCTGIRNVKNQMSVNTLFPKCVKFTTQILFLTKIVN